MSNLFDVFTSFTNVLTYQAIHFFHWFDKKKIKKNYFRTSSSNFASCFRAKYSTFMFFCTHTNGASQQHLVISCCLVHWTERLKIYQKMLCVFYAWRLWEFRSWRDNDRQMMIMCSNTNNLLNFAPSHPIKAESMS